MREDIDFDYNYSNTELVNLNNPINDSESESEIKITFDNSKLKNTIIKGVEKYFSCAKCSNIISDTRACQKCDSFICGNCSCEINKCPTCETEKQMVQDKNIDSIVSEIFNEGKVVEENLNFGILSGVSLKNLRQENTLNTILKEKEKKMI